MCIRDSLCTWCIADGEHRHVDGVSICPCSLVACTVFIRERIHFRAFTCWISSCTHGWCQCIAACILHYWKSCCWFNCICHTVHRLCSRCICDGEHRHVDGVSICCLLYTSDAADERSSVDLGGRRIIK